MRIQLSVSLPLYLTLFLLLCLCQKVGVFLFEPRDEQSGKTSFSPGFHIEIADDGNYNGANEVDQQVVHGIDEPDIQIAAESEAFSVDCHVLNVIHRDGDVTFGRIQQHGLEGVDDGILLHVQGEEVVHGEFKKLPYNADGHGKAEGDNSEKYRRELNGEPFASV